VFDRGNRRRSVASTNVHERSSRSHSVLMVDVSVTTRAGGDGGRLFLVDLAGSERVKISGVSGEAMREATHINSSLSALGDVMHALETKAKHVPYRNSKLTHLLSDALASGSGSRTALVVTVCPTELTVDESVSTLMFASRVRNISLGPAAK
ncbi:P-loop containing nucleoside triphosphate hydrolase protein, partial [Tribonema minus]